MKKSLACGLALLLLGACGESDRSEIYNENNTSVINGVVYNINEKPISGLYKTYYSNGNTKMKIAAKNGKPHGIGKFYRKNGSLQYQAEFKDGVLDGIMYQFYISGTIHNEMHYEGGVCNGAQKTFDADGNQTAEVMYENGKPVSGYVILNDEKQELTAEELAQIAAQNKDELPDGSVFENAENKAEAEKPTEEAPAENKK